MMDVWDGIIPLKLWQLLWCYCVRSILSCWSWLWLQPNTCSVSSAGVSDAFEGDRSTLETDFFRRNCVICAVLPILLAAGKQPPGKAKLQAIGQACDIRLRYKRKVKLKTQITARFKTYIWCAFSSSLWTFGTFAVRWYSGPSKLHLGW